MSIFSDHSAGAMSDAEFRNECNRMNRQDRYEREQEHERFFFEPDFEDLESMDEETDDKTGRT